MFRRPATLASAALLAGACSGARYSTKEELNPGLTVPTPIAEGKRGEPTLARRTPLDAGAPAPQAVNTLPDPEPLSLARQWQYDIAYERGRLRVERVQRLRFPKPVVTARQMGRYAIELWIGAELVERVRFDFPLLAAEEPAAAPRGALQWTPNLASTVTVSRRVLVPASPRATRALLIDRATGETQILPWPPDAPLAAVQVSERAAVPPDAGPE